MNSHRGSRITASGTDDHIFISGLQRIDVDEQRIVFPRRYFSCRFIGTAETEIQRIVCFRDQFHLQGIRLISIHCDLSDRFTGKRIEEFNGFQWPVRAYGNILTGDGYLVCSVRIIRIAYQHDQLSDARTDRSDTVKSSFYVVIFTGFFNGNDIRIAALNSELFVQKEAECFEPDILRLSIGEYD